MILKTSVLVIYGICALFLLSFIKSDKEHLYRGVGYALLGTVGIFFITPYMWLEYDSIVQSGFAFLGSILSFYISLIVILDKKSMTMTTKMIVVTTATLLISYNLDSIRDYLVVRTAQDTVYILNAMGYESEVLLDEGSTFINFTHSGKLKTEIVMACTGIGTMSIFMGVISTIQDLNKSQKLYLSVFYCGFIYVLNMIRNVFIAASYGGQHLHVLPNMVEFLFGRQNEWVSYYIADKIISQPFSAVAIGILMVMIFTNWRSGVLREMVVIIRYMRSDYRDLCSSKRS